MSEAERDGVHLGRVHGMAFASSQAHREIPILLSNHFFLHERYDVIRRVILCFDSKSGGVALSCQTPAPGCVIDACQGSIAEPLPQNTTS